MVIIFQQTVLFLSEKFSITETYNTNNDWDISREKNLCFLHLIDDNKTLHQR